ncbi:MAG TPA: DNA-formamidopyrimidine glycosylase family protein [Longimicrobiaceae bacterium]|nr:DNA-formamidopyrimidine glycosylase family protein [Longimicrobiaceae bacterium]
MPELPEIELYLFALEPRILGRTLDEVRIRSASLLRTWDPPVSAAAGRKVLGLRRIGKRIVIELEDELFLVFHLMISGRFRWKSRGAAIPRKGAHAALDFPDGTLLLTEASTHKRASLHVVQGEERLRALDPGGIEPLDASLEEFRAALTRENHTLKRALTDPRLVSGIGNAHSDEILLEARLSPLKRTAQLGDAEVERLYEATRGSLTEWVRRLREEAAGRFPGKVTAFHPGMKAHGRFGAPCPSCGTPIQRIVHGEHETNYCPACQTEGRLLKDRALSRLLGEDWPRTVEEMEGR